MCRELQRLGGFLPPGGNGGRQARASKDFGPEKPAASRENLMNRLVEKGLSESQSPSEMLPYLMMTMLMEQQAGKKKTKDSKRDSWSVLGGSSSDDTDADGDLRESSGMKAVVNLNKLRKRIKKHPRRICAEFEREVVEEMGVIEGQSWTMRDWLKRQQWGKFKGISRCAVMDVVAYAMIRNGQVDAGCAQLIQNLKAKVQSVIQGGDWSSAWLLTGIPDPLLKKEFGGSREELAVVSGYINALSKLRKKVRQCGGGGRGHLRQEVTEFPGVLRDERPGCIGPCLPGLNSDSKFMRFYHWLCGAQGVLSADADNRSSLFPCNLPYPEALLSDGSAVVDDLGKRRWAMNYINVFVAWGNYVELGCPDCRDGLWEPPTLVRSRGFARWFADRMLGEVEEFASLELMNVSLFFEGSRQAVEQALRLASCTAAGYVGGSVGEMVGGALPVQADRVAMPEHAGEVDPLVFLPDGRP